MRYGRLHVIATAAVALFALAGCGTSETGGRTEASEPADALPTAPQIDASVREEVGPPPATEAERRWLEALARYKRGYERATHRSMTLTQATMADLGDLYGGCADMLRDAGDPGRYAPAARVAERACRRLSRAERMLTTAASVADAGGAIEVGTPEEAIHERAIGGSFEAAGNGGNDLRLALARARAIERQIEDDASIPRRAGGA